MFKFDAFVKCIGKKPLTLVCIVLEMYVKRRSKVCDLYCRGHSGGSADPYVALAAWMQHPDLCCCCCCCACGNFRVPSGISPTLQRSRFLGVLFAASAHPRGEG